MRCPTSYHGRAALAVGVALLLVMGCRQPQAPVEETRLSKLASYYGRYITENKGKTPDDEKQLKAYIQKIDSSANLDELFVSPRDNEPYVVRYKLGMAAPGTVTAYEKTGVGGKKMIGLSTGQVRTIDDSELQPMLAGSK